VQNLLIRFVVIAQQHFAFIINQAKFDAIEPALLTENVACERFRCGEIDSADGFNAQYGKR
jgi:hypothetical protein